MKLTTDEQNKLIDAMTVLKHLLPNGEKESIDAVSQLVKEYVDKLLLTDKTDCVINNTVSARLAPFMVN